jgi:hypothetical protein
MTPEEAREVLNEVVLHVDLVNLGRTIYELGRGHTWNTFDNSKWRPQKQQALKDSEWLVNNVQSVVDALKCLKIEG